MHKKYVWMIETALAAIVVWLSVLNNSNNSQLVHYTKLFVMFSKVFFFFALFFRKTPVFTSAMPITNGRWIYEAFEQIMTLSSIREYVPSIRKCTSIHTHYYSLYTNHQTKIKKSRLKSNKHEEKERSTSMIYITYF